MSIPPMVLFECQKCGKSYEVETMCCGQEMDRENNTLTCAVCDSETEIPSCCGEKMEIVEE